MGSVRRNLGHRGAITFRIVNAGKHRVSIRRKPVVAVLQHVHLAVRPHLHIDDMAKLDRVEEWLNAD